MSIQTLYDKLQQAKTEEDVKDIYIKTLWLKSYVPKRNKVGMM
jgi:hypothetical protein